MACWSLSVLVKGSLAVRQVTVRCDNTTLVTSSWICTLSFYSSGELIGTPWVVWSSHGAQQRAEDKSSPLHGKGYLCLCFYGELQTEGTQWPCLKGLQELFLELLRGWSGKPHEADSPCFCGTDLPWDGCIYSEPETQLPAVAPKQTGSKGKWFNRLHSQKGLRTACMHQQSLHLFFKIKIKACHFNSKVGNSLW